jgi:predicted RNA binding protein YcfA (HicA-like mRNA interferase family)
MSSNRRDLERFLRKLSQAGYKVTRKTGSGHWHVRNPTGELVAVTSSTPSDVRTLRNFRSEMRRAGAAR